MYLFTIITDLEAVPDDWQNGIIKPLPKAGSVYDIDNYRGITLTSNVHRVYSKILEESVMTYLKENNILGDVQGAFRNNRRTEDHKFSLQGICSIRKAKKY